MSYRTKGKDFVVIQSKDDLRAYLEADNAVQPMPSNPVRRYLKKVIRMKILLRKSEYHYNNKDKNIYHKIAYLVQWQRCRKLQDRFCSEIPINVFGKGLIIWHPQRIIINGNTRVGDYCSISTGVILAQAHNESPVIGDHVEIMVDAKVLGGIHIADNVRVGADALVIKAIEDPNTTWGGVPAKMISNKGTLETPIPIAE